MSLITAKEAIEILGVSDSTLCASNRYLPFYTKKPKDSKQTAMFDLKGFLKYEDTRIELLEKTRLFVEYLIYIEGVTYTKIASMVKSKVQLIASGEFGYRVALKICTLMREFYPFFMTRFDEYYNWKPSNRLAKLNLTIDGWRITA